MNKTWLVLKHELITTITRRSFLLLTFGIPILAVAVFVVFFLIRGEGSPESITASGVQEDQELHVEGYVDQSGLVVDIPGDLPADILIAFKDEAAAQKAIEAGEISAYYLIPEDYIASGDLYYIYPDVTPLSSDGQDWMMRWTLLVNMLEGKTELAKKVWNPMNLEATNLDPTAGYDRYSEEDCSRPGYACESNAVVQGIPQATIILIYIFIAGGASMLLRNVANEKQNQMIEVLMTSVDPQQMFTGKIIGLGIASMIPTLVWIGTGFAVLSTGGSVMALPEEFTLPVSLLLGWLVFFLLGYALYASLMAGVGAMAPNLKEANQAVGLIMLPMVVGYVLSILPIASEAPQDLLALIISLFPLTSPFGMVMRMVTSDVPFWQVLLSAGLLIITIVFVVRGVERTFRAQALLSGQPFKAKIYIKTLIGRV